MDENNEQRQESTEAEPHPNTEHRPDTPSWVEQLPEFKQKLWIHSLLSRYLHGSDKADVLYHYTSADAFWKILDNGTIWLTNAAYLNDQEELTYPVRVARDFITKCASKDEGEAEFVLRMGRTLDAHVLFKSWHIASFSSEGNLLSQWRAYCPAGGYALGLAGSSLADLFKQSQLFRVGRIIYDEQEQRSRIEKIVTHHLDLRAELLSDHPDVARDDIEAGVAGNLGVALSEQFVFFKSSAFSEEHEWRVVKYHQTHEPVRFRERNGVLVPYLEVPILVGSTLPLKQVYVSPLGEQDLAFHGAVAALTMKKYSDPEKLVAAPGYRLRF